MNTFLQQLYSTESSEIHQSLLELNSTITSNWSEITEELPKLIELSETLTDISQQYAYLLVSKCYFYIESYDEAVLYALKANKLFNFTGTDSYSLKMVTHLIDMYISARQIGEEKMNIQKELENQMNIFFNESIQNNELYFTCGIALDCKRVDIIKIILEKAEKKDEIIEYIKVILNNPNVDYQLKSEVFELICETVNDEMDKSNEMNNERKFDIQNISECLVNKNDCEGFLKIFATLSEEMKMQILLDYDGISQKFRKELMENLPEEYHKYIDGKIQDEIYLHFLYDKDNTDNLLLNNIKGADCTKSKVIQMALLYANAFMNYGTTNTMFLKDNNSWIKNASNWDKFATTASMGVLYKGTSNALRLMQPFAPGESAGKSDYAQAGRLFGLGLIFPGRGTEIMPEIVQGLKLGKNNKSDVLKHGGCLGVGLAGISTEDYNLYNEVKEVMNDDHLEDTATSGMAAAMAMGLIMMGSGNFEVVNEMMEFAQTTIHERVRRGMGIGIALTMLGMQDKADNIIDIMLKDPLNEMKYGGVYTIAMAYLGTANQNAVSKLLQVTMTERNEDVKRAAVSCIGFVLNKRLDDLCRTLLLLIDSYNPHVRYGCAMALGIAGVGSNNESVFKLLKPLLKDPVDFVKQGAAMAMGMVLIQTNEKENKEVVEIMKQYEQKIQSKREGTLSYFGHIIGLGIMNCGGRNCTISMYNSLGSFNLKAIAGIMLFTQYWYWYPLTMCLSTAFTPTTIIGITPDFKIVEEYEYISNAPSDLYAYLPHTKPPQKAQRTKIAQTKLSYANKQRTGKGGISGMSSSLLVSGKIETPMEEEKKEEVVVEVQPFVRLPNRSRVTPRQISVIKEVEGGRYVSVKKLNSGLIILKDTKEGEMMEEENAGVLQDEKVPLTQDQEIVVQALMEENNDTKPPEPFEFNF